MSSVKAIFFLANCIPLSYLELIIADLIPKKSIQIIIMDLGANEISTIEAATKLLNWGYINVSIPQRRFD